MIQNKGSDTMINLAQALAEEYEKVQPGVPIAVSGGGSGVGIASMQNGTVDIANASREMKQREKDSTRKRTGKEAIEHVVGYDALAIYVHENNPLTSIKRSQLACIYGKAGACTRWSDLGVEVPGCSGQEIVRVSRQNNSGTYAYFREWTLEKGQEFKLGSRDLSGSKDVVDLVAHTPCAIGYSGMGYKTDDVKWLCLSKKDDEPCTEPSLAATLDGSYKLSRPLYMITRGDPSPDVVAYLEWVRSDAGQVIVERTGYAPLPPDQRSK
ncbi:MAG: phosphate ABC transporter substrate-binding protein [Kofleriaceae bacterium]|nr:MAG: phosphate ABC transporter substrate-binding protein [Kofleriaceae bacterium]MBZ0237454.1 phosphate ABC transporter substrate-binding protein [Kofleriaceae bacterium]